MRSGAKKPLDQLQGADPDVGWLGQLNLLLHLLDILIN